MRCRLLEQQVRDLGQQVTVLLNQVQSLQGSGLSRLRVNGAPSSSSSAVITSDDIISARLLSFEDIQVGGAQLRLSCDVSFSKWRETTGSVCGGMRRACSRRTWSC